MRLIIHLFFLFFFSLALFAQPSSSKLIKQGISLHDQKKYMEAISCYQQALRVNPSSMSAVYEMSLSYFKLGDYDNAIKHSTQVINMGFEPILIDAYVVKGTALAAQEKLGDAITLFKQAIEKCGNEYLLLYNLGLCYYNNEEEDVAAEQLRKALELEATHPEGFLLYAYALNDLGKWIESFYAYHFFLLLEPNTQRSVDAFVELYDLLDQKIEEGDPRLDKIGVVDRSELYNKIQTLKPRVADLASKYKFFESASNEIFTQMVGWNDGKNKDLLWNFFVPVYKEILDSGHFPTYCRYISVACFPESHTWWETNKVEVDNFIKWFEHGESTELRNNHHVVDEE